MIKWAIGFLLISVIAGIFGFTGIAVETAMIAKILFFIAAGLFVIFTLVAVGLFKTIKSIG